MSSIGPQLPPQPTKRKRHAGDEHPDSPPSKVTRSSNDAEIPLDSDSEDDYGPSAATAQTVPTRQAGRPSIGPSLPPRSSSHEIPLDDSDDEPGPRPAPQPRRPVGPTLPPQPPNQDEIPINSSDDDAAGPALPPRSIGPTLPPQAKRVQGPSLPPGPLSEPPPGGPDSDSDSDSDYGPALPSSTRHTAAGPLLPAPAAADTAGPRRDDWMVAPPPPSVSRADPTRIKARGFSSNPRGGGAAAAGVPGEIGALWTETAADKRKRLADQVLGRAPAAAATPADREEQQRRRAAEERDARIRASTEAARGRSMYEEHQSVRRDERRGKGEGTGAKGAALEDEDDPSKRAFDWEKDMRSGTGVSHSQRKDMVNRAADFGGRFQKGSYL